MEGLDAVFAADGVLLFVIVGDLEQFAAEFLRQVAAEFGLAGAGWAVQQHIDAGPLLRLRLAQVSQEHGQVQAEVRIVVEPQRWRRTAGDHAAQQGHGVGVGREDGVGKLFGQQFQLAAQPPFPKKAIGLDQPAAGWSPGQASPYGVSGAHAEAESTGVGRACA